MEHRNLSCSGISYTRIENHGNLPDNPIPAVLEEEQMSSDLKVTQFLNSHYIGEFTESDKCHLVDSHSNKRTGHYERFSKVKTALTDACSKYFDIKNSGNVSNYQKLRDTDNDEDNVNNVTTICRNEQGNTSNSIASYLKQVLPKRNRSYSLLSSDSVQVPDLEHGNYKMKRNTSATSLNSLGNKSTSSSSSSFYHSETNLASDSHHTAAMLTIPQTRKAYHRYEKSNSYQAYIGQLKIHIIASKKELLVKIHSGIDLQANSKLALSVGLVRKAGLKKVKYQESGVVSAGKNPLFEEEFSFALKKKDYCKRLVIYVMSCDSASGKEEQSRHIIGCMSFGVESIIKNGAVINGWYYLLVEGLGLKKHMRAPDQIENEAGHDSSEGSFNNSETSGYFGSSASSSDNDSSHTFNAPHKESNNTMNQSFESAVQIILNKFQNQNYGFMLMDSSDTSNNNNTVLITNIKPGSPAEMSGLEVGDRVIGVNGESVQGTSADHVGGVIRHFTHRVMVEVVRCHTSQTQHSQWL